MHVSLDGFVADQTEKWTGSNISWYNNDDDLPFNTKDIFQIPLKKQIW